jgi:hypothetical protein
MVVRTGFVQGVSVGERGAVTTSLLRKEKDTSAHCAACGAPLAGSFCAACGQRALDQRHTIRSLVGGAFRRLFDAESGLTHTLIQLAVNPGRVVRDYLAGRTIIYTHPVAYVIVAFAVFVVAFRWSGGMGGGGFERLSSGTIPLFLAVASRIVFWRAGLNYAEHLIVNMFLFAQVVLIVTGALVLGYVVPESGQLMVVGGALAVACAYVIWSYTRVFSQRPGLAAAGGLLVLVLGVSLWGGALVMVIRLAT